MVDGGTLKRHYSDLVSASATSNQSDVKLIDPFQLIDFKTRILPEHLYPKFRLHLDNFKTQNPDVDLTETPENPQQAQENDEIPQDLTGDQRVDRAMGSNNSNGTDVLLRRIMESGHPERIEYPTDLRGIQRPKSFNKRKDKTEEKKSGSEYREPIRVQGVEAEPNNHNQQVYEEPMHIQPEAPNVPEDPTPMDTNEHNEDNSEEFQGNLRRSTRVPRMSARYLQYLTDQSES